MMKKRIIAVLLALALTATLTACGTSAENAGASAEETADSSLYHLRLAYSPSLCQAPLHVAVEKGFFAEEGIDAENVQLDAAHVQEAVGADQVDAGFGLIGKFLQPIENGLNIKFTAGIHTGCIKIAAPADSGITTIADLAGKKIGVSGLAGAETIIAKRALSTAGISVDEKNAEVEFVVFSKNDLGQALENAVVDAIALGDPTISQFIDQYDLTTIIDTAVTPEFADEYCCASFVTAKLAQEHPDIAAAYTRAVMRAAVWVEQHPEEAAKIQLDNDYVTGDLAFNTQLLTSYNYIPSVQGGYDAIKQSVQQLADIGILQEDTDAQAFTDNSYVFLAGVPDSFTAEEAEAAASTDVTASQTVSAVSSADGKTAAVPDCCEGGDMAATKL